MEKKIFKAFNWAVGIIFILSICSLDGEKWILPTVTMFLSGTYLIILAQISELKRVRGEK